MIKNFSKEELMDLVPSDIQKKLTKKQVLILGYFIMLDGLDESKTNGTFYRSNDDIVEDLEITEPTLLTGIRKLETLNLVERKVGIRSKDEKKASVYLIKKNNIFKIKDDMNKVNEDLIKGILDAVIKIQEQITLLNDRLKIEDKNFTYQNPLNKGNLNDRLKIEDKNFTQNFTSDTDIELDIDKDIEIKNNIIPDKPEEIKEKEKNIINYIQKEKESSETENNFEAKEKTIEDKNNNSIINETQTPLEGFASKKEEMNEITKQTPTVEIEKPVEKEIINSINVEKAVVENNNNKTSVEMEIITPTNESAIQYKFMHYDEQLEKFNILIEKLKKCTSAEELTHKHSLMQKYMREHTFLISFLDKAQRTYRELIKNFETPTEKPNKDAVSPSDELDGIIFSPTDFNALEPSTEKEKEKNSAKREREETNEAKLSPTSPSNDEDGITTHQEENNATGTKETALETKREERLKNLNELIDTIETLSDFKFVQKRVNASWDVLTTEDIAELAEKLTYKAITL